MGPLCRAAELKQIFDICTCSVFDNSHYQKEAARSSTGLVAMAANGTNEGETLNNFADNLQGALALSLESEASRRRPEGARKSLETTGVLDSSVLTPSLFVGLINVDEIKLLLLPFSGHCL